MLNNWPSRKALLRTIPVAAVDFSHPLRTTVQIAYFGIIANCEFTRKTSGLLMARLRMFHMAVWVGRGECLGVLPKTGSLIPPELSKRPADCLRLTSPASIIGFLDQVPFPIGSLLIYLIYALLIPCCLEIVLSARSRIMSLLHCAGLDVIQVPVARIPFPGFSLCCRMRDRRKRGRRRTPLPFLLRDPFLSVPASFGDHYHMPNSTNRGGFWIYLTLRTWRYSSLR